MRAAIDFETPTHDAILDNLLSVLVVYEDFERGTHAKHTCDLLAKSLGEGWRVLNQMWKFSVLELETLREMAVRDAVTADIIMVSVHSGSELPEPVKLWIADWSSQPRKAMAMVALFDGPSEVPPGTPDTRAWLAEVARRTGLEFFAQPAGSWAQPVSGRAAPSTITEVFKRPPLVLAGNRAPEAQRPHWGINE